MNKSLFKVLENIREHSGSGDLDNLYDYSPSGEIRWQNLVDYMAEIEASRPELALIGEAPGYLGSAQTGVPFVSESQAYSEDSDFRNLFPNLKIELNHRSKPYDEGTSNAMWATLRRCEARPFLWSACFHHPHSLDDRMSNRTPRAADVVKCWPTTQAILANLGIRRVVSVGSVAHKMLSKHQIVSDKVRHPARGGRLLFDRQLTSLLTTKG